MFNLEQSIAQWRKQMLAAGIKAPVPLEELEAHLREEIERQMRSGLGAQFAFDIAARQIGQAKELKAEFSKQRRLRDIFEIELISKKWGLKCGPILALAIVTVILLFSAVMVLFTTLGDSEITPSDRASILAAIALSGVFAYAGYFGYRFFPVVVLNNRMKMVLVSVVGLVWFFGIMIFLARVNVGIEQLITDCFWAYLVPAGVLCGLSCGFERAEKLRPAGS